jgi:hypothetical protein
MKRLILIIIFANAIAYGQNVGISNVAITPDASSMLEVRSTNKGMLIPRVALTSTTDVATIAAPALSLLVFNTNTISDVTPGFYYWGGASWLRLATGSIPASGWQLVGNAGTNPTSNFLGTTDAQDFVIRTNNSERIRVTSAGNVGINTTPTTRFHVNGPVRFQNLTAPAGELTALVIDATGIVKVRTLDPIAFNGYTYTETDPTAWRLTGNAATGSDFIGTTNSVDFAVRTSNIERMRVASGGNVGIGTTSPTTGRLVVSYSNTDIYGIHVTMPGHAMYGDASGGAGRGVQGRGGEYGIYGWHLTNTSRLGYIGSTNYGVYGQFDTQSYGILGTSYEGIVGYSNKTDGYGIKAEGGANAVGGIWAQGASGKLSGYFGGMARFYTEYAGQFSIEATRNTLATNDNPSSVVEIVRKTTAATMGTNMGAGMLFSLEYGATPTKEYMGAVYALRNGANTQGRLVFSTRSGGTNPEEKMTILHNGNVGVGVADPWTKLNVKNGRLAIEYDAGFDHAGALWYHKNPWVYLWRRETVLAANQGGNVIFAASRDVAGTPADIAMIVGARENATNNNTASFMAFYTRPPAADWLERLRINSSGHFDFKPENATSRTILMNDLGVGGGGSEPSLVPSSNLYGFVGVSGRAWYQMYAQSFNATSTKDIKANITVLSPDERLNYYQMVKNLNVCSYNYIKTDTDSLGNIVSQQISPRQSIGLIAEEAPTMITDESGKAISLYEYVSILAVALQEAQRKIEELELMLEQNGIKKE